MTLVVYTARITYAGPDRLDITRKTAAGHALAFAPSWRILGPMINARRDGRENGPAGALLWDEYVEQYTAEMRASYRGNYPAWAWLLGQDERTLVCYCTDPTHCHRTLLAGILGKLGADVRGEREARPSPEKVLRMLHAVSDYDQTAEEAEAELRADGVDVDSFIASVHDEIERTKR